MIEIRGEVPKNLIGKIQIHALHEVDPLCRNGK